MSVLIKSNKKTISLFIRDLMIFIFIIHFNAQKSLNQVLNQKKNCPSSSGILTTSFFYLSFWVSRNKTKKTKYINGNVQLDIKLYIHTLEHIHTNRVIKLPWPMASCNLWMNKFFLFDTCVTKKKILILHSNYVWFSVENVVIVL